MRRKIFVAPLLMVAMLLAASAPTIASAEGGAAPASTDATTACASPGTNPALATLCGLYAGNTLPEAAQAEVARMIVKLWKAAQEPAKVTTPEAACALTPAPHTALPVLCTLWTTGSVLPPEIKEVTGRLVVHLANGKFDAAKLSAPKPEGLKKEAAPKTFQAPTKESKEQQKAKEAAALLAKCQSLLAANANDQSEKAQYCRKFVAGETLTPNVAPKVKDPTTSTTSKP